jgi:hypothetical protein
MDFTERPDRGAIQVCPDKTHVYLFAITKQDGGMWYYPLTVEVSLGPPPTPTLASLSPSGPLSLRVDQGNIYCPTGFSYAVDFQLRAGGGAGNYVYFLDDRRIGGPTNGGWHYTLYWQSCGAAVGTFRVESGGQEARMDPAFYIRAPRCCR